MSDESGERKTGGVHRHESEDCSRCGTTKTVGHNCNVCNWPGPDNR